jgi:hypothetical protein
LVPELLRGLIVICCIFAIILPTISVTDDLAQAPFLAEGVKIDALGGPEHLIIQFLGAAVVLIQPFFFFRRAACWWEASSSHGISEQLFCWNPNIESRPPPYSSF